MHKILLGEYSVLNIYENFGGGDFSPGKNEFGVAVVRFFLSLGSPFRGLTVLLIDKQRRICLCERMFFYDVVRQTL